METVSNISTRKELYCQISILSVDYTIGFKNKWRLYSGNTGVPVTFCVDAMWMLLVLCPYSDLHNRRQRFPWSAPLFVVKWKLDWGGANKSSSVNLYLVYISDRRC